MNLDFALTLDDTPEGLIHTALNNVKLLMAKSENDIADPNGYLLHFIEIDLQKALDRIRAERDTAEVHIMYDRKKA